MTRDYEPIDPTRIKTYSLRRRRHKSSVSQVSTLPGPGATAGELLASFPGYLGALAFGKVVDAIVAAVRADRPVAAAFGAHVIKVGCGSVIIDFVKRGIVRAVSCNGACAIHDVEIALNGETSEEVAETIREGTFGMVAETLEFFDQAVARARRDSLGLGTAIGELLIERNAPFVQHSVFAAAREASIPIGVHVALGTDTIHVSRGMDGAALGEASMRDFRLVCDVVSDLGAAGDSDAGGVWLNIGSAVVLPEVFLKAVSVARNLGANLDRMTTANLDMIRHYRPVQNVVSRPVAPGRGHEIIGHHEIMLPLLRQAVVEKLAATSG
ncbi:MAG: hypothetical protein JSU63_22135 [Phycisphaerales bacterium]|nr:MAG: hypothetical protein JSU63_22135 [Phycisphaerales bacterium]